MEKATMRKRLLASTIIAGATIFGSGAAFAQAPDAPAQEVVVTGTRIPHPNLNSVSPITTVSSQEIKLQGTTNVEDLINNLPQAFGDYGGFESNGASGTATIDLRGLGNVRTLVLIDGKRLQPGDPAVEVPDINFIPPALIDRVDVLTGGASAVYGSDAIAGVVNFILKKNFQGIQIDAETQIANTDNSSSQVRAASALGHTSFGFPALTFPGTKWDGQRHTVNITGGINSPDDKGNVEFYFGYTSIDPVLQGARAYSKCSLATNNSNTSQQYCGGSSTDATGRLEPTSGPNATKSFNLLGTPTAAGILPSFSSGQDYNYAPLNYIQRPDTRYTAGAFSNYEVNKALTIYSSFMFLDDHSIADIGPSGSFFGDNIYTIPCADPLLSAAQKNTLCGANPAAGAVSTATIGRRDVEGGPRVDDIEHDDYRMVIGAKGVLPGGWTYDISAQYGRTTVAHSEGGYFSNSKLINALDVVSVNGVPTCQSVVSGTDTKCVPYNIFTPGGVTPAALAYLENSAIATGSTTEQVVTASIGNDLSQYGVKSPFSDKGVGVSFGLEYRREALEEQFDSAYQSGDLAGLGGEALDTSGSQSDRDAFVEASVPLAANLPFIKDLTFETGYRYSDYTSGGGNDAYKFGLEWQVISDIKFRGSYERAVRAPNVQELFQPQTPGEFAGTDPCAGTAPTLSAAQCYNTFKGSAPGVTLAQFTSTVYGKIPQCVSSQCGAISGGNTALKPEEGTTKSLGVIFTPSFIPHLSISVDYFDIDVEKAVVTLPAALILSSCATTGNAASCALIARDPALGYTIYGGNGIGYVDLQQVNAGNLGTRGLDAEITYRFKLSDLHLPDLGGISVNYNGTYVSKLSTTLPGETYNCAGYYGITCGTPTPHYRSQMRVSWNTPWNVTASLNWRFLSGTKLDIDSSQAALNGNGTVLQDLRPSDAKIPDYSYFDLAFTWRIKDKYTIRGGVNNIFDKTPPLLDSNSFGISAPPFGNGNTYPQVFDPLGRVIFLGLTAAF